MGAKDYSCKHEKIVPVRRHSPMYFKPVPIVGEVELSYTRLRMLEYAPGMEHDTTRPTSSAKIRSYDSGSNWRSV